MILNLCDEIKFQVTSLIRYFSDSKINKIHATNLIDSIENSKHKIRKIDELDEIVLTRRDEYNYRRYKNKSSRNKTEKTDYMWRIYYDSQSDNYLDFDKLEYENYSPDTSDYHSRKHDEEIANHGVAYISYRISTGQICSFFYQSRIS